MTHEPSMLERVARAMAEANNDYEGDELQWSPYMLDARAAVEAMLDVENDTLKAGYEAMFASKWNETEAPMMGAGWYAMITSILEGN